MSRAEEAVESEATPSGLPAERCDVVMKGGVTSGVVHPEALCAIGSTYRRQLMNLAERLAARNTSDLAILVRAHKR